MLRAQGNLPYQRTHRYSEGFDVVVVDTPDGGILQITNDAYAAQFIGGQYQQPYHDDTGWRQIDSVVMEFRPIAERELQEIFYTIVDPFGGIR